MMGTTDYYEDAFGDEEVLPEDWLWADKLVAEVKRLFQRRFKEEPLERYI